MHYRNGEAMEKLKLDFDIMWKDRVTAHVNINGPKLEYKEYIHEFGISPFWFKPELLDIMVFLEGRCWERNRADINEILKLIGLDSYDPVKICKITHGVSCDDFTWIRYTGENIKWKELNPRER